MESQSLLLYLPNLAADLAEGGLRHSCLVLMLETRRSKAPGLSFSSSEEFRYTIAKAGKYLLCSGVKLKGSPVQRLSEHSVGVNHGKLRGSERGVRLAAFSKFAIEMIHQ